MQQQGSPQGFLDGSVVKNPLAVQEMHVPLLSREDPLRRKWQPTPVFLPGKSHRQRSLVGYSLWGLKEPDMTQQLNSNNNKVGFVKTWLITAWNTEAHLVLGCLPSLKYFVFFPNHSRPRCERISNCALGGVGATKSVLCTFLGECIVLKLLFQGAGVASLSLDRIFLIFIYIFDYLVSVVARGIFSSACGIQFSDQGLNLGPLHWELRVLATGPLRKSLDRILSETQAVG